MELIVYAKGSGAIYFMGDWRGQINIGGIDIAETDTKLHLP